MHSDHSEPDHYGTFETHTDYQEENRLGIVAE